MIEGEWWFWCDGIESFMVVEGCYEILYILFVGAVDGDWIVKGYFRDCFVWVGGDMVGLKYFELDFSMFVSSFVLEVQFFLLGSGYDSDYVYKYVVGDFNGDGVQDVVWFDNVNEVGYVNFCLGVLCVDDFSNGVVGLWEGFFINDWKKVY